MQMGQEIGVGVIGVGTFGSLHAKVYSQLDGCKLIAVADVNEERLQQVCDHIGVDGYTDYHELLKRDDITAVSICTTDELHVEPCIATAHAGKHIFVEKPLALTPEDCDRIIQSADTAKVLLMVGHILRFDPRYYTARMAIAGGKIGELVHMYARRNNPIGSARRLATHTSVLFFLGIHDIDFMNWCVGAKVQRVSAEATHRILSDTPDSVLATLRFANGTIALLEVSWVLPESFPGRLDAQFEAVGTTGTIYVNGSSEVMTIAHERIEQPELFYAPEVLGECTGILMNELRHFINCVRYGTPPLITGNDAKTAVEVACAIKRSYETGSIVEL
ncbi:MAG TPA: Gfo/Idh/MocA family oxidoreductase [Armatimonadetes bacterium]|nr:Gfo/Idh/MocA family oxidoreductase [Armatimonadota bacterium]